MANCTVRGNKTTKELKKGVSILKKSCFKILCMVLIIALLAPNVFAATPAPEAPLADAATVARVKQEIANGEITDMEDLFLVAYQHLGADLEEEGLTAYINEDGTLGITQIISSEKKMTRSGEVEENKLAFMTVGSFDNQGRLVDNEFYEGYLFTDSDSDNEGVVHATLTIYATGKCVELYPNPTQVRFDSMKTTIIHTQSGYVASELVQEYKLYRNVDMGPDEQGRQTVNWPASGTHTYNPGGSEWYGYNGGTLNGKFDFSAKITVTNISAPIRLSYSWPLYA